MASDVINKFFAKWIVAAFLIELIGLIVDIAAFYFTFSSIDFNGSYSEYFKTDQNYFVTQSVLNSGEMMNPDICQNFQNFAYSNIRVDQLKFSKIQLMTAIVLFAADILGLLLSIFWH
jgi:hypothetical protein